MRGIIFYEGVLGFISVGPPAKAIINPAWREKRCQMGDKRNQMGQVQPETFRRRFEGWRMAEHLSSGCALESRLSPVGCAFGSRLFPVGCACPHVVAIVKPRILFVPTRFPAHPPAPYHPHRNEKRLWPLGEWEADGVRLGRRWTLTRICGFLVPYGTWNQATELGCTWAGKTGFW